MKRYGNLYEQITDFANLYDASQKAISGHRDKPSVIRFWFNLENELFILQNELKTHTYQPRPYQIFFVREPKLRQICAAPIRDRVVHHAVCSIVGPIWEKTMISDSFACRVGKGTLAAILRAKHFSGKFNFFLQCDIKHYFAMIDRTILQKIIRRKIKDQSTLQLLDVIIEQDLHGSEIGKGVPIGNLTSQYFANLYLNQLDHFVKETLRVKGFVRYMDDFLLYADDIDELHDFHLSILSFAANELNLQLKENRIIAPCSQGISFLGFRTFPHLLRLQGRKWRRFRQKIETLEKDFFAGEIKEDELANRAQSMIAHISKADSLQARRKFFAKSRQTW